MFFGSPIIPGLAAIGAMLLPAACPAASRRHYAAAPTYQGTVAAVSVGHRTITIRNRKHAPQTFNVASNARIRVNQAVGKRLGDIHRGMHASIRSSDGITATAITAGSGGHHRAGSGLPQIQSSGSQLPVIRSR